MLKQASGRVGPWEQAIVNGYGLLREIERLRPLVGSLIQTILEPGANGEYAPSVVLSESGEPIASLRTIVRAMEVLDSYARTNDFQGAIPSRAAHAYGLVERAVDGKRVSRRQLSADNASESGER